MEHHHWIWNSPLGPANMETLVMVWAVMAFILILAFIATRKLEVVPSTGQVLAEGGYDFCRSITMATAGPRGDQFLYYVGALFLFIWFANLAGQIPLGWVNLPEHAHLSAPTSDFNVPAALAALTLVMYFFVGIRNKGLRYFKHYISPDPWYIGIFFLPLNIIEDITRPGSLMIRLYFNILVGHILMGIAQTMMPHVLPVFVILLELFVATIQAYIFAILSSVYISLLSDDHH
ncbi:MAG: F0F1 ATP synthase subunit A [Candidatus Melainabacteria bacterium]